MGNVQSDSNSSSDSIGVVKGTEKDGASHGLPPILSQIGTESVLCCCVPEKGGTRGNLPQDLAMQLKATSNGHGICEVVYYNGESDS